MGRAVTRTALLLVLWSILGLPPAAYSAAQELRIQYADLIEVHGVYRLNASIDYELTPAVKEALVNGVDLVFDMKVEVLRQRDWWPDSDIAIIHQRNRLAYHALSRQYVVENLNTGVRDTYPDLASALRHQGVVRSLPIIDAALLADHGAYSYRLRVRLARNELPLPLRARSYFSSAWQLASGWRSWRLN